MARVLLQHVPKRVLEHLNRVLAQRRVQRTQRERDAAHARNLRPRPHRQEIVPGHAPAHRGCGIRHGKALAHSRTEDALGRIFTSIAHPDLRRTQVNDDVHERHLRLVHVVYVDGNNFRRAEQLGVEMRQVARVAAVIVVVVLVDKVVVVVVDEPAVLAKAVLVVLLVVYIVAIIDIVVVVAKAQHFSVLAAALASFFSVVCHWLLLRLGLLLSLLQLLL